jgi:hypothetical protein
MYEEKEDRISTGMVGRAIREIYDPENRRSYTNIRVIKEFRF